MILKRNGDFRMTSDEVRDILRCTEKYEKFMLVLNTGGPVDLSPVLDEVENILVLGSAWISDRRRLCRCAAGQSLPLWQADNHQGKG